jgi:hypothetical protein
MLTRVPVLAVRSTNSLAAWRSAFMSLRIEKVVSSTSATSYCSARLEPVTASLCTSTGRVRPPTKAPKRDGWAARTSTTLPPVVNARRTSKRVSPSFLASTLAATASRAMRFLWPKDFSADRSAEMLAASAAFWSVSRSEALRE